MHIRRVIFYSVFCAGLMLNGVHKSQGQEFVHTITAEVLYGLQWPAADLSDRYFENQEVGLGTSWTTRKGWIFGLQGTFIYGRDVKEDVLFPMRDEFGRITGGNGLFAAVELRQRGLQIGGYLGKLFRIGANQNLSGIRVSLGTGFMQHKIRIQDDAETTVPQLVGDRKNGYDRLTNGWAIDQFIGYQFQSKDQKITAYLGFATQQGFTQNRRDYNYDTGISDTESRLDVRYGIRLGWILAFELGAFAEEVYY